MGANSVEIMAHQFSSVADSVGVAAQRPRAEPREAGQLRLHHAAQPHPAPQEQGRRHQMAIFAIFLES